MSLVEYNLITDTDSYKHSHFLQYPHEKGIVSSYIESRGGRFDATIFAGIQIQLRKWKKWPLIEDNILEARDICAKHGTPFNEDGWRYILDTYKGALPIRIQAVKEGLLVPTRNVLVQIVNTDENVPWLTSFVERALVCAIWYPTTVATVSYECKMLIKKYLRLTASSEDGLLFKLHDFGSRGVGAVEQAGIGGVAHLFNFLGTDTMEAIRYARAAYDEDMAGFSIPASEHSSMTPWPTEEAAFRNMLEKFGKNNNAKYGGDLIAVVSDSYDIYKAVIMWCTTLLKEVQDSGSCVVIRPDSGKPVDVIRHILHIMEDKLGSLITVNEKGFKELPPYFRLLQGDGVNMDSIKEILQMMLEEGWSTDMIAFGMGAELLQKVNRDTQRFAQKASAGKWNGDPEWTDIFKDPITDAGKGSKRGRLALFRDGEDRLITIREDFWVKGGHGKNYLEDVYLDGKILRSQTLTEIRELAGRGW